MTEIKGYPLCLQLAVILFPLDSSGNFCFSTNTISIKTVHFYCSKSPRTNVVDLNSRTGSLN